MRYMMMIAVACMALTACGSNDSTTIETEDGTVTYDVDGDNEEVTASFSGQDGQNVTVNSGVNVAADLPDGFSLYPGATVVSAANVAANDGKGTVVLMTTSDSPESVLTYYRSEAERSGIDIATEMRSGASQMLAGESADGKSFTMTANGGDDETTVQLMVGDQLGE